VCGGGEKGTRRGRPASLRPVLVVAPIILTVLAVTSLLFLPFPSTLRELGAAIFATSAATIVIEAILRVPEERAMAELKGRLARTEGRARELGVSRFARAIFLGKDLLSNLTLRKAILIDKARSDPSFFTALRAGSITDLSSQAEQLGVRAGHPPLYLVDEARELGVEQEIEAAFRLNGVLFDPGQESLDQYAEKLEQEAQRAQMNVEGILSRRKDRQTGYSFTLGWYFEFLRRHKDDPDLVTSYAFLFEGYLKVYEYLSPDPDYAISRASEFARLLNSGASPSTCFSFLSDLHLELTVPEGPLPAIRRVVPFLS
jgi:hypothetical protein